MRTLLDLLYRLCAALAALSLLIICGLILASSIGRALGIVVPSANELAGFAMASATFLALAPTLRAGGHIRVKLVIGLLPARARRWTEAWCLLVALALVSYLAYWASNFTYQSYQFGDLATGLLAVPMWIPQLPMAFGLVVLAIALLEALVDLLRGREPAYAVAEAEHEAQPQAADAVDSEE